MHRIPVHVWRIRHPMAYSASKLLWYRCGDACLPRREAYALLDPFEAMSVGAPVAAPVGRAALHAFLQFAAQVSDTSSRQGAQYDAVQLMTIHASKVGHLMSTAHVAAGRLAAAPSRGRSAQV
jgi:hypothetical protein